MTDVSVDDLKNMITRLENACKVIANQSQGLQKKPTIADISSSDIQNAMLTTEKIATLTDYWNKVIRNILDTKAAAAETKVPELETLSEISAEAICAHQDLLLASEKFVKPSGGDVQTISRRLASITQRVSEVSKNHKELVNHCEVVQNGLSALFWIFQDSGCDSITQTYFEMIAFPGNKIFKEKKPEMTKWVKNYKSIIKEVNDLVNKNYKSGLNWNPKGKKDTDELFLCLGNTYRENFKKEKSEEKSQKAEEQASSMKKGLMLDIHQGTKLKPIQKIENQEKPKPLEKKEDPLKHGRLEKKGMRSSLHKQGKIDEFDERRNTQFSQNFANESKVYDAYNISNKTSILISNSIDSTFDIPRKVNKVGLTNCENVKLIMESLISTCEITNCMKVQIFVKGTVNSFSIDQTEQTSIHLSEASKEAQFYTSKSSDVLIRLQKENDPDDYNELIIPEQFVFTITPERKLEAKISDLYGY